MFLIFDLPLRCKRLVAFVLCMSVLVPTPQAKAFWLLNFQTAPTLPPGGIGFIGGTGGQFTSVGTPKASSFTPFLAHAGIRFGVWDSVDVGYRLCTLPLPYSSAGPSLGSEVDVKIKLARPSATWQVSAIGGVGFSYLRIVGQSKDAWAPGVGVIFTHRIGEQVDLSWNARYVYTAIPTATGGADANNVQAIGGSMGVRFPLSTNVSLLPEFGVFDFIGAIAGASVSGWGVQYGAVLSARIM